MFRQQYQFWGEPEIKKLKVPLQLGDLGGKCRSFQGGSYQPIQANKPIMSRLFHRLQPAKKFRITIGAIAQLLKIPKHSIARVECWAYIIFVHRLDRGGQFISYRQLQHWLNAVACQIQNSSTCQQLRQLWLAIEQDWYKYKKQYSDKTYPFLSQIWTKCWNKLSTPSPPPSETLPVVPEALQYYPDA